MKDNKMQITKNESLSKVDEMFYELKNKKKFLVLNNIKDVPKEINKSTKKGDSILIKGSRCWQLEKIIELIN